MSFHFLSFLLFRKGLYMDPQDALKRAVSVAALEFITPNMTVGIGTGSTIGYFIDALATIKDQIAGTVSSSELSTKKLQEYGIHVLDSNDVSHLDVYIDSADEINAVLQTIKGGGGALTREKVLAAMAKRFICIVNESKVVSVLGMFPLPVEVIPMARSYVVRELTKLGGTPVCRQNVITDNGNYIIDVHNLRISDPIALEEQINAIAGVVTVGLFAKRPADTALIAFPDGIKQREH